MPPTLNCTLSVGPVRAATDGVWVVIVIAGLSVPGAAFAVPAPISLHLGCEDCPPEVVKVL
jgi:hypothetical protein